MTSITIRNIGDSLKQRLRMRTGTHGRSIEDEARDILRSTLTKGEASTPDLAESIRVRLASVGGVELEIPAHG